MGNLSSDEKKYKAAFDCFIVAASTENADVLHLPYPGGALQQPNKTMMMWKIFKNALNEHIAKENKKKAQRSKGRR